MLASDLLSTPERFCTGALARDRAGRSCGTAPDSGAVTFDCLGAFLWCYPDADARQPLAKALFKLCEIRHGHKRLGRLDQIEAVELLRAVGA